MFRFSAPVPPPSPDWRRPPLGSLGSLGSLALLARALAADGIGHVARTPPIARAAGTADRRTAAWADSLQIKEHDVKVTINNGIAVTTVTQVFHNTGERAVRSPLHVSRCRAALRSRTSACGSRQGNGRRSPSRKRARAIYDSYKQLQRDPGCSSRPDFRTFDMRIFPIAPRRRSKGAGQLLPGAGLRSRLGDVCLPSGDHDASRTDARTTAVSRSDVQIEKCRADRGLGSPSQSQGLRRCEACASYVQASYEAREAKLTTMSSRVPRLRADITRARLFSNKPKGEDGLLLPARSWPARSA
jgi:Ca-activated chloride channel family protein